MGQLRPERIEQFKIIYKKHTGEDISDKDALEYTLNLSNFAKNMLANV